jgi:hypothetical protein
MVQGVKMRTSREFSKETVDAHWCEKCDGKIMLIEVDMFGNTHCGYCHQLVHYPKASKEELEFWMRADDIVSKNKKLFEALENYDKTRKLPKKRHNYV